MVIWQLSVNLLIIAGSLSADYWYSPVHHVLIIILVIWWSYPDHVMIIFWSCDHHVITDCRLFFRSYDYHWNNIWWYFMIISSPNLDYHMIENNVHLMIIPSLSTFDVFSIWWSSDECLMIIRITVCKLFYCCLLFCLFLSADHLIIIWW